MIPAPQGAFLLGLKPGLKNYPNCPVYPNYPNRALMGEGLE